MGVLGLAFGFSKAKAKMTKDKANSPYSYERIYVDDREVLNR